MSQENNTTLSLADFERLRGEISVDRVDLGQSLQSKLDQPFSSVNSPCTESYSYHLNEVLYSVMDKVEAIEHKVNKIDSSIELLPESFKKIDVQNKLNFIQDILGTKGSYTGIQFIIKAFLTCSVITLVVSVVCLILFWNFLST